MKIYKCEFVRVTELFDGLSELFQEMIDSEPYFTWGENNHSLIRAKEIEDYFSKIDLQEKEQFETLKNRISELNIDLYVDLEN